MPLHDLPWGPRTAELLLVGRRKEEEASVQPSSVLPGGGGGSLLSSPSLLCWPWGWLCVEHPRYSGTS